MSEGHWGGTSFREAAADSAATDRGTRHETPRVAVGGQDEESDLLEESGPSGTCSPEQQLWCAVIVHTLYEATGRIGYAERGERQSVRQAAIAWFEEAGADFQSVCELAGLIPSAVRAGALRVIRNGRLPRIRIAKSGRSPGRSAAASGRSALGRAEPPIASGQAEARC